MSYDRNYRRPNARNRNPIFAPPHGGSSSNSRHHSVLGYWVPVIITGTIAIGGIAAWIWSERNEHDDDDHYPHDKPTRPPTGQGAPYPTQGSQPYPGPSSSQSQGGAAPPYQGPIPSQSSGGQGMPPPVGGEAASYYGTSSMSREQTREEESGGQQQTFFGQMRGAMRRTPSPQQFLDQASRTVGAGMAAAGKALGSIMEEDGNGHEQLSYERREDAREGFSDHERWSEEAEEREVRGARGAVEVGSARRADELKGKGRSGGKRMVAVVLSADTNMDGRMDEQDVVYTEHASILSHLPPHHDPTKTDLFVLIYAPGLTSLPPLSYRPSLPDAHSTLGSSYSELNTPAVTPGSELASISPRVAPTEPSDFASPGRQFDALYTQALSLVSSPTQILPFTTPAGYVAILRHLAPQMAYVSDMLAGEEGSAIKQLKGWVGHTVLVVGDEGTGGLADTETEDETPTGGPRRGKWYEESSFVGLGKEVEVVDAARVGEDWSRRVGGRE